MIVGNGMIAKTLKKGFEDDPEVLIYASGVSDSGEIRQQAYERELNLLCKYMHFPGVIVYFSTCSIFDPSLQDKPYIQHKRRVEQFIENNAQQYLILRLPNLVGRTNNPNTFFNFIKNRILKGEVVTVYKNATRYFLDTEDLIYIIPKLLKKLHRPKEKINVVFNNNITILETINIFRAICDAQFNLKIIEKGIPYFVDNKRFIDLMGSNYLNFTNPRVIDIFSKYIKE